MSEKTSISKIKPQRAIIPVFIGLAVVGWLFYREFNPQVFNNFQFNLRSVFWILAAFLCIFGRDIGYMIRIRILSKEVAHKKLSWRSAFRIIMLWEFTSAVTPSAIGGTSFAILFVSKEGISVGKSSSMVMLTSFLDELYFLIAFPLVVAIVGFDQLFFTAESGSMITQGLMWFAIAGYSLKVIFVAMLSYGLFINPRGLKWLLMKVFSLRILKRWRRGANNAGYEIVSSSKDIRNFKFMFWLKSFAATALSWSSRYLVANALIIAFFAVSDQVLLFARQLVMWIMMLVMPTPGGSGFAELIFTKYCSDLISIPVEMQLSAAALIAFLWRGVTYYPYLLVGAVILPRWIKEHFTKKQQ